MGLAEKSKENIDVAEHFISKDNNVTAIVGNMYYAVFQRAKDFLISNKFDYRKFLDDHKYTNQRPYSHGTIKYALFCCIKDMKKTVNLGDIADLSKMDKLYRTRVRAHYEPDMIRSDEGRQCIRVAKQIIATIESVK